MAYDVKLGSGFRLDIVDINPVGSRYTTNSKCVTSIAHKSQRKK